MTDSLSPAADAQGEQLPSMPQDPSAPQGTAAAAARVTEPGAVLLLVDASPAPGWAADAAIELATTWAQAGRRIVLADLHLEHPVLHERLGETNRDGVVDIFLYGASLARSARPVAGRGFYLIPAGTYAADTQIVLRHSRWPKLLAGFRDANATLLLFAPADAAALETLARWSTNAIVLGERTGEAEQQSSELPPGVVVLATVAPPPPDTASGLDAAEEPQTEPAGGTQAPAAERKSAEPPAAARTGEEDFAGPPEEEARELSGGSVTARASEDPALAAAALREAEAAPPPPAAQVVAAPAAASPPPTFLRQEPPRRGRSLLLWLLLGAVVLAAVGAVVLYLRSDLLQREDAVRPAQREARAGAEPPVAPAAPAVPAGTALPYAVHIRAYRSQGAARDQVAVEERRLGDQPVYISPELIQGILYYRLLAGLPADSAAAVRLRQRLLDARAIDADDAAGALDLIRYTPVSFRLGEFATRSDALARADSLFAVGIPSYPAVLPYSDGSERWLLYGGAFRDSADAEGMRELLARAGLEAPLVERRGRPSDSTP